MEPYGKRVLSRIKSEGLADIGEDALKAVVSALCDELVFEVKNNDKLWDNYAEMPILAVKDLALKHLDKLDGKEG